MIAHRCLRSAAVSEEYAAATVRREVSRNISLPTFQEYEDATRGGSLW